MSVELQSDRKSNARRPSPDFNKRVGGGSARIADARLGIYLHMLADRISHHACLDYHSLYHMWEQGVPFDKVPAAHRTTAAALDLLYDELLHFAKARHTARSGADDKATKAALLAKLLVALEKKEAAARVTALSEVACKHGYQPFPGAPACR